MDISINISYLNKQRGTDEKRGLTESSEILKKSGFKYVDFSVENVINSDWEKDILAAKSILEEKNLTVDQTHAPFMQRDLSDAEYEKLMMNAFKASKILGAENIVIHADRYVPDSDGFNFDKALNSIYDFYAPFVEYAVKNNLGVAIENLGQKDKDIKDRRFSAFVEDQIAIIDKFNDPLVTACWDVGHGNVTYGYDESIDAMKKLGSRLTATHIHDNIYSLDLHSPIFAGNTKWELLVKALKDMNYQGKFTLEFVYGVLPEELIVRYMSLYRETAEFVIKNY